MPCNCKKTETVPSNICEVKKLKKKNVLSKSAFAYSNLSAFFVFQSKNDKKLQKKKFLKTPQTFNLFATLQFPKNQQKILYSLQKKPRRKRRKFSKIICGML